MFSFLFDHKAIAAGSLLALLSTSSTAPSYAGTFWERHPRRAEVLRRDNHLSRELCRDRGQLGGHYRQLERQDMAIRRQEQRDARMNGGHITPWEKARLNREENRLQREIRHDYR